jgi:hypothetical protein
MNRLASLWASEPAILVGALASILALLIAFGVHISDIQTHAIVTVVTAFAPLVAAFVIRSQVSPATPPPPAPPAAPKPPPSAAVMAMLFVLPFALGCNSTEWTVARDATGVVCAVAVQSTNPELAPICAGLDEVEAVVAQLVAEHQAQVGAAAGPYKPDQDAIYEALRARRASGK